MEKIEDIFYKEIIKESAQGCIDCDFIIPICFGTKELRDNSIEDLEIAREFPNTMLPTLIIKDRDRLNSSIKRYVSLAREFYKNDIRVCDTTKPDKYIIASALVNTLVTDFQDISGLFNRSSDFLEDKSLKEFLAPQNIGYSSLLHSNIMVEIKKQSIVEEAPYGFNMYLSDEEENIIYKFPTIRFGISQNKAYIYAVQKESFDNDKKIERILRKVGEGLDITRESKDPIENPENLYSVSPWALVALSVAIPIIKNNCNVNEFVAPYFLVNRWNSLEISYQLLQEKYNKDPNNTSIQTVLAKREDQIAKQDEVQRNITDKFLRNFRRLEVHFSNINIDSFQLDMDSCLHFKVTDDYACNNKLLNETYEIANNYRINNIKRSK